MADDQSDDVRADAEHQVLARSGQLQHAFLDLPNRPENEWFNQPHIVAHAIAETLGRVLAYIVVHDPNKAAWAGTLLDHIAALVAAASRGDANQTRH